MMFDVINGNFIVIKHLRTIYFSILLFSHHNILICFFPKDLFSKYSSLFIFIRFL